MNHEGHLGVVQSLPGSKDALIFVGIPPLFKRGPLGPQERLRLFLNGSANVGGKRTATKPVPVLCGGTGRRAAPGFLQSVTPAEAHEASSSRVVCALLGGSGRSDCAR